MRGRVTFISKILILMMIIILAGFGCKDELTVVPIKTIFLTGEDVGVTDALLHITITNDKTPSNFSLKLDGRTIFTGSTRDTMILSDVLLPKHTYTYKAYRLSGTQAFDSSDVLIITTMDTTSHNFTWDIDTLGDGNSSVLYDVAIINDTLAYAVGEIYKKDSTGQFETEPYGLAIWNGRTWRLQKLLAWTPSGYVSILRPHGIFAFSNTDIWVTSGGVHHWDGKSMYVTQYWINSFPGNPNSILSPGQTAEKLWGTSSSNIYIVGNQGAIAHYNGTIWKKMESGTDVNLTDVWGSPDGRVVFACGWVDFKPTVLLRLKNTVWEKAWEEKNPFTQRDDTLSGAFTSIWMPNNRSIYALSWYGIYRCPVATNGYGKRIPFPLTWSGFPWRLRGSAINDWFIVGEYYMIAHFNGVTFKHYSELSGYGRLVSVDQKNNFVVAVGYSFDPIHSKGLVFRGRR